MSFSTYLSSRPFGSTTDSLNALGNNFNFALQLPEDPSENESDVNQNSLSNLASFLASKKNFNDFEKTIIFAPPPPDPFKFLEKIETHPLVSDNWGLRATMVINDPIPEDSLLYKILSCIPVFGFFVSTICLSSLKGKIKQEFPNTQREIDLRSLKVEYKICSMAREVLSIALIVTALACGILSILGGIFALGITGACLVKHLSKLPFKSFGPPNQDSQKEIINKDSHRI